MDEMKPVIDISYWQRAIDYGLLADAIAGVILRGAYGIWPDTQFEKHYTEFAKRNIPIGIYHYIIGNYSGKRQAEIFRGVVKDHPAKMSKWNDVEDRREGTALTRGVVDSYTNEIESMLGEQVGIYTGKYAWDEIMGVATYSHRKLWIANYGVTIPALPRTGGWTKWEFWQFTSKGRLPGYASDLDVNRFNGTATEFHQRYGGVYIPTPPPVIVPPGTKYCSHCGAYAIDDANGCCSACGAPRVDPGYAPTTMRVISPDGVRIRTAPNPADSNNVVRLRNQGEIVNVLDIFVVSASSVWVKDAEGWSAVVHAGTKYLD